MTSEIGDEMRQLPLAKQIGLLVLATEESN
jgi:hypothetical protein